MGYTPDMRRISLALVVAAPLLLSGCDLAKMFGKNSGEDTSGHVDNTPAPAAIRSQTRGTARQLQDAFNASAGVIANGEDPGRITFDGSGVLPGHGLTPGSGVTTGMTPRYGPRGPIPYTPAAPRGPIVGPVPTPAGPLATLPPANVGGVGDLARGAGPTLTHFDAFQRTAGLFNRVFDVVSRATWGAQAPRHAGHRQTPDRILIHHTVTAQTVDYQQSLQVVKQVQNYHRNVADNRKGVWDDIGYHFLIDGAGRVFEGRHAEIMGVHAGSGNAHSVAISMIGNFDRDQLTEPQRDSMVRLVSFLSMKYRKDPSAQGFISGHRHHMSTGCPGKNVLAFLESHSLIRESQQVLAQVQNDTRFRPAGVIPPA